MPTKMTTEEFIEKAKAIHGNKYDYSKVEYEKSSLKVIITCPNHGDFYQRPNDHLSGYGCPKCASDIKRNKLKLTSDDFIKRAKEVHGDKYDYSKVEYKNNNTKVVISCPEHGDFKQTPDSHFNGGGCHYCGERIRVSKRSHDIEEFIEKSRSIHGDKYDYSKVEYKNAHTKVTIICPEHGEFTQNPGSHLNGNGCNKCSSINAAKKQRSNKEEFIEKAKKVHGDKYDYSKVEYEKSSVKVTIVCPIHGDFEQTPSNHLNSYGCFECGKDRIGFWSPEYIRKYYPDKLNSPCTLYILECYSENERFIKVGITTKTLEERYQKESLLNGYSYNTVYEHQSTLIVCSELEYDIINKMKNYQYKPDKWFKGSTECLQYEVLDDILSIIKQKESNAL